ncbi:16S rRNA (uracil(1498)-N(3))-methyltransferase [Inquilinus sp. CAU 1745]|uniref:16S rRNA (uracil(1498)-N(3))-methyltransferase n=1 Tax=Inquilinus sp. CAU 1745 TaxID=3140369 RepID=UPI00325A6138
MARATPRLFVAGDLAEGGAVLLSAEQAHYLRNVLRLGLGNGVTLFNGRDGEWKARLDHIGRNAATAIAETRLREQAAGPDVRLCFAPVKKVAVDAIAEKATELGVARLMPVLTAHTDVSRVNVDRLRAHAVEAAEQCERLDVPSVDQPVTLDRLLAGWPADRPLILCAESGDARPVAEVAAALAGRPVGLLIGPEGGFAQAELDGLAKLPFVHPVGLGPRILRADTAAVAALACWQCLAGDWRVRPPGREA